MVQELPASSCSRRLLLLSEKKKIKVVDKRWRAAAQHSHRAELMDVTTGVKWCNTEKPQVHSIFDEMLMIISAICSHPQYMQINTWRYNTHKTIFEQILNTFSALALWYCNKYFSIMWYTVSSYLFISNIRCFRKIVFLGLKEHKWNFQVYPSCVNGCTLLLVYMLKNEWRATSLCFPTWTMIILSCRLISAACIARSSGNTCLLVVMIHPNFLVHLVACTFFLWRTGFNQMCKCSFFMTLMTCFQPMLRGRLLLLLIGPHYTNLSLFSHLCNYSGAYDVVTTHWNHIQNLRENAASCSYNVLLLLPLALVLLPGVLEKRMESSCRMGGGLRSGEQQDGVNARILEADTE